MRIFFDTEFMEDGEVILPLSLGFVAENGKRLYVVIDDADRSKANPWVRENVIPHLPKPIREGMQVGDGPLDPLTEIRHQGDLTTIQCPRAQAAKRIESWLMEIGALANPRFGAKGQVEFWADYASYDWIVLCQLFGTMLDLPKSFPMFVRDIQQFKQHVGYTGKLPEVEGQAHNALDDAENVRQRHRILQDFVPTATWPHPCASRAEPAARRIMRDIEGGHLRIWGVADQSVRADREYSKPGFAYATFWGWLKLDPATLIFTPTEAWEQVRG